MKAIVYTKYGPPDVLQFKEVEKPAPKEGQILVKVYAASANPLDWHFMRGSPFLARLAGGLRKPKNPRLGADIAGRVEAVGAAVTQFRPGDEVFGQSKGAKGAFAEYACADENELALKPAGLSFEQAAAAPVAAITALQGLRDHGQIHSGQKVLIHGASGGVGTFAVQLAKAFGAEVTAVSSTRNVDMARQMGADHVIDYTQKDFSRNGQRYDLIVAVNGNHPLRDYLRALNPGGLYVALGGSIPQFLQGVLLGPLVSRLGRKKVRSFIAKMNQADLLLLKELLETGKVVPVIEKCYPLNETAEAISYLAKGHARGKVVIMVDQNHESGQIPEQNQAGVNS